MNSPNGSSQPQLWIIVRRWKDHQHYRQRNPPWIKNKTELLHKENYLELPIGTRGILHGLWLEYAACHGELPLNTRTLSYRLRTKVTREQLDRLVHCGFIEYALAPRYQDASASRARGETETETETQEQEQELTFSESSSYAVARENHDDEDPDDIEFTPKTLKDLLTP